MGQMESLGNPTIASTVLEITPHNESKKLSVHGLLIRPMVKL